MGFWGTLTQANRDIWILWGSVLLRIASFALTNQVLTLFLKKIAINEQQIGWFMTLTLFGDVVVSYFLTWYADVLGRRAVMRAGCVMMMAAGAVFCTQSRFEVLLVAAVVGVVSPSGDETGPFKSVEEACLAHLTPHSHRPEVFALYGLLANFGQAVGALAGGLVVDGLGRAGVDPETSYRVVFAMYAAVGAVKLGLMMFLSDRCEVGDGKGDSDAVAEVEGCTDLQDSEESSLLPPARNGDPPGQDTPTSSLSPATKRLLFPLLVVFMLDSLGYGFMPAAWVVYYFRTVLAMSASAVGVLFFVCSQIGSFSSIPSAWFARSLGPVRAMLVTQAPSAVFFLAIALTQLVLIACGLLVLYYATMSMDVVPRQVLLSSMMPARDLTKVMGIVNIGKTFARCVGPVFTGRLATDGGLHYAYFISAGCVLLADVLLAVNFLHMDGEILEKQAQHRTFE